MRLLLTGADGQLGRALQGVKREKLEIIPFRRGQLDITDPDAISHAIREHLPDVVVNAAAYTAVDGAETNIEAAFKVNKDGPAMLAAACATAGVALIHVSTDFVFDGDQSRPYRLDDRTNPLNVYGASKLAGEEAVLRAMPDALIIRTSWLYSLHGRNFVTSMLKLFRERETVRVVADQYGSPTSAKGFAEAIAIGGEAIHASKGNSEFSLSGIRHHADSGVATWHALAVAVREEAVAAGFFTSPANVDPVTTENYPTAARRPRYSALDPTVLRGELNLPEVHWRDAVAHMFNQFSGSSSDLLRPLSQTPVGV